MINNLIENYKEKKRIRHLKNIEHKIGRIVSKSNEQFFRTENQEWYSDSQIIQEILRKKEESNQSPSLKSYKFQDLEKQNQFLSILKKQEITPREFIFPGVDILTKNLEYIKEYLQDYFEKTYFNNKGFHQVNKELEKILVEGNKRSDGSKLSTEKELNKIDFSGAFGFALSDESAEILRNTKRELKKRNLQYDSWYTNFDAFLEKAKKNNIVDIYFTSVLAGYINKIEKIRSDYPYGNSKELLKNEKIFETKEEIDKFIKNRFDKIFGYKNSSIYPRFQDSPFISNKKLAKSIIYLKDKTNIKSYYFNNISDSMRSNRTIFNLDELKEIIREE